MDKIKSTIKVYDKIAEDYAKSFKEKPQEKKIILQFIKSLPESAKILDAGCGNSDYFDLFFQNDINYTGIDLSKEMINVAKKLHPKGKFFVQDMNSINFDKNSFEGIFCFYSLIHISKINISKILNKFNSILTKDGKLLLALQEGANEVTIDSPFLPGEKMFLNLFSKKEISELLEKSGFQIIKFHRKKVTSKKELPYNKIYILASK
jgi:ubiquinone/menaquinone biosynthesis C-methylase UbiE